MEYTSHITSPELFRKWAGIAAIAGALERKVWVRTKGSALYPNLYTIIVAPPGIGKTEVTWRVREMWDELEEHHVANSSVTKASLIDDLAAASRRVMRVTENPPIYTFNSLLVASNELGVLIPSYENEFMNALTDLYDGKGYSESRRTRDIKIKIDRPNLNLFAGCTPGYLRETLPPGAWDQGFLSRVILVYSGEQPLTSLFAESESDQVLGDALKKRLQEIGNFFGKYGFTEEARNFLDYWYLNGQEPRPTHPRLAHYNTRRAAHLIKLSMIATAARTDEMLIQESDVRQALDWLVEAEFAMPDIFKSMTMGGDSQIIDDCFHHLYTIYMREGKKPVAEARLILFLQERTPAHNIVRILETMERAKMIQRRLEKIGTAYVPISARPK